MSLSRGPVAVTSHVAPAFHPGPFAVQLLMYKQALFCYEELLLFAPNHPNYLVGTLYNMRGDATFSWLSCETLFCMQCQSIAT